MEDSGIHYVTSAVQDESHPGTDEKQPTSGFTRTIIEDGEAVSAKQKHTVLIVDDEMPVLMALRRAFASEDFEVLTTEHAAEALEVMAETDVTLVISDYRMPGLTGIEFLRTIMDDYPDTIRMMLTSYAETKEMVSAIEQGVLYKFVAKPWNDDDLRISVKLALRQHDLLAENKELRRIAGRKGSKPSDSKRSSDIDTTTLGGILVGKGLLLPAQLDMVEKFRQQRDTILAKALVDLGMIGEQALIRIIQDESKADLAILDEDVIDTELSTLLPRETCEVGCIVPVRLEDNNLQIAMADPLDLSRIEYICFATRKNVTPLLAAVSQIEAAIRYMYGDPGLGIDGTSNAIDFVESIDDIDVLLDEEELHTLEQVMSTSGSPPAVLIVNAIISEAIRAEASDIHIEPKPRHTLVRYRINGLLQDRTKIPGNLHLTTISRLKILAKMDISERRVPQDGRITVKAGPKLVDIRVSSMPTINGEKIVCRLLNKNAAVRQIDEIGIRGKSLERLKNIISMPQGMIIATGPTGSGKTTSLYSLMKTRLSKTQNFITIEDPVEYLLESASQVHVHQKAGLTFASSLRATLRQDPDVILLGEIRDGETAAAAFQAAMTGHLVFTTLHTNSTVATISRLFHLGVEAYLVASAVQGIIAQRLVRTVCPKCGEQREYDRAILKSLRVSEDTFPNTLFYGNGCNQCNNTGYSGRTGLFEVFQMNSEFRQFLTANYRESHLLNMARTLGMETLLEDGLSKVRDGLTTLEELMRVLGPAVEHEYECSSCGRELDMRFTACPYCGEVQREICKKCEEKLEPEWVKCPFCGTPRGSNFR